MMMSMTSDRSYRGKDSSDTEKHVVGNGAAEGESQQSLSFQQPGKAPFVADRSPVERSRGVDLPPFPSGQDMHPPRSYMPKRDADAIYLAQPTTDMLFSPSAASSSADANRAAVVAPLIDRSYVNTEDWPESLLDDDVPRRERAGRVVGRDGVEYDLFVEPMPMPGTKDYGVPNFGSKLETCFGTHAVRKERKREVEHVPNAPDVVDGSQSVAHLERVKAAAESHVSTNRKHCQLIDVVDAARPKDLYDGLNTALPLKKRVFLPKTASVRGVERLTRNRAASNTTSDVGGAAWKRSAHASPRNETNGYRRAHDSPVGVGSAVAARMTNETLVCVSEAKIAIAEVGTHGAHAPSSSSSSTRWKPSVAVHSRTDDAARRVASLGGRGSVVVPPVVKGGGPRRRTDAVPTAQTMQGGFGSSHLLFSEDDGWRRSDVRLSADASVERDPRLLSLDSVALERAGVDRSTSREEPSRRDPERLSSERLLHASRQETEGDASRDATVRLSDLDDAFVPLTGATASETRSGAVEPAPPTLTDKDAFAAPARVQQDGAERAAPYRADVRLPASERPQNPDSDRGRSAEQYVPASRCATELVTTTRSDDAEARRDGNATDHASKMPLTAIVSVSDSDRALGRPEQRSAADASNSHAGPKTGSVAEKRTTRALAVDGQTRTIAAGSSEAGEGREAGVRRSARLTMRTNRSASAPEASGNTSVLVPAKGVVPDVRIITHRPEENVYRDPLRVFDESTSDGVLLPGLEHSFSCRGSESGGGVASVSRQSGGTRPDVGSWHAQGTRSPRRSG